MMNNSPMMMMDIGKIKKELMDSVERSHGEMTLSMLVMEDELKAHKTECEELKEEVLRLKEDKRAMMDREERREEKYRKLVEDVKKQEEVSKTKVVELQHKIKVLERGKRWADERYRKLAENVKIQEEVSKMKVVELQRKMNDLERARTSADARVEQCKTMSEALGSNALRMEEDIRVLMRQLSLVSTPVVEDEEESLGAAANAQPDNVVDLKGPNASVVEISDSDDEPIKENSPPRVLKRKRALLSKSCDGDMWENESELLLALEKCPELCMRAVCALYRENCFEEVLVKGLEPRNCQNTDKPDALRGTILAKFLIDGNPQAMLKKSILELQKHDPRGLEDCKRLSIRYCHKLFEIYTKFRDPLFLPFF